jgi:hypothetical protein
MFDVNLLDRMNFGDLGETLGYVLERMDALAAAGADDDDDPRMDVLLVIANQIFKRMDSIVRDYAQSHPEVLEQWSQAAVGYEEQFKQYSKTYLKGGVPLLMVEPEESSQASDAEAVAAWRAKVDALVLDEKLLDGMNAGDLAQINRFIIEQVEKFDKELPEEMAGPLIDKLLKFDDLVIRRLDPLVRETYVNQPEKLAEWEAIQNDYKDLDEEDEEHIPADIESSEVS